MLKISTRVVILIGDYAFKIPIDKRGYLQGINEKKIWDKYGQTASIAKLYWMFLGVVCQKRYNRIKHIPKMEVVNIKKIIPEFDFENCDFWNYENWGVDDNKYILLDNSPYVASLYN